MVVLGRRLGHLLVGVLAACALAAGAVPVVAKEKGDPPPGLERKAASEAQQPAAATTETTQPAASPEPAATTEPAPATTTTTTQTRSASAVTRGRGAERSAPHSAVSRRAAAAAPPPTQPAPAAQPSAAPPVTEPAPSGSGRRGASSRRRDRARSRRRATAPRATAAPAPSVAPPAAAAPVVSTAPAPAPESSPDRETDPRPQPAAGPKRPEAEPEERPSVVTRTVTEFVEVVPKPLRYVLIALAVLALLLFAGFAGAAVRARRAERLRRVLAEDVGLLQSALLPALPERIGPAHVTAAYRPASGPAAGGDFYDAFALDEHRTCVLVGDVAGHGREALPLTAAVRYTVRAYLESGLAPRQALQLAGEVLDGQLRGQLVTVVAAVYDARTSELTYASAGHPAPIVDGETPMREVCGSPPLGTGTPTGRRGTTVAVAPGASVCFHTDGVFDVRVAGGRLGPDGLHTEIDALGPAPTAADLLAHVTAGSASQPDDMAAVVLRAPVDAADPPAVRRDEFEVDLGELAGPRPRRFLEGHGIEHGAASDALASAAGIAAYAGTALIVVTGERGRADVAVHSTGPVPLRYRASA